MKIVFLDFDGVLNSLSEIAFGKESACFNLAAVDRLNRIVRDAPAKVVVTSTWRVHHSLEELHLLLKDAGFCGEIIGCTPIFSHENAHRLPDVGMIRCREIQAWIDTYQGPITSFVVLDDMALDTLAAYHVHTDIEIGLCEHHVEQALAILG